MGPVAAQVADATADLLQLDTVSSWLRKHGKPVRPRLDRRQLDALRECFDIIDTDGTGTITADELQDVFKVQPQFCFAQTGPCRHNDVTSIKG